MARSRLKTEQEQEDSLLGYEDLTEEEDDEIENNGDFRSVDVKRRVIFKEENMEMMRKNIKSKSEIVPKTEGKIIFYYFKGDDLPRETEGNETERPLNAQEENDEKRSKTEEENEETLNIPLPRFLGNTQRNKGNNYDKKISTTNEEGERESAEESIQPPPSEIVEEVEEVVPSMPHIRKKKEEGKRKNLFGSLKNKSIKRGIKRFSNVNN